MQIIHQLAPQSVAKHGVPRKKDETLSDVPLDEVVYNEQIMNYAVSAQRDVCGKCSKSIKLYCCKCSLPSILCGPLPSVKLPVPLIILRHHKEREGKSTAIHAEILAENLTSILYHKNDVTSITEKLKSIPDMAMLFPQQEDQNYSASPNNQASHSQTEQPFKALLVLDGTWIQVKQMYRSIEYLHTLKKVSLKRKYRTCFWRTQCEPEDHLATIEAIYLIYKEHDPNLDKDLKNLLLFYKINYDVIMNRSAAGPNNFN